MKNQSAGSDHTLAEFESRDLGDDMKAAGTATVVRPKQRPTSILLPEELIAKLREKGAKLGVGYQSLLKMILAKHVDEY